jgi:short subunit dehydrogenase-like uncharacterized protein
MVHAIHPLPSECPLKMHSTLRFQVLATEVTMATKPSRTPLPSEVRIQCAKLRVLEVVNGHLPIPSSSEQFLPYDVLEWHQRSLLDGEKICSEPQALTISTPATVLCSNDRAKNVVGPNIEVSKDHDVIVISETAVSDSPKVLIQKDPSPIMSHKKDEDIANIPGSDANDAPMVAVVEDSSPTGDTADQKGESGDWEMLVDGTEVLFVGDIEEFPDLSKPESMKFPQSDLTPELLESTPSVVVVDMQETSIAQDREIAVADKGEKVVPSSSASTESISTAASTKENDTLHVASDGPTTTEKVPLHLLTTTANASSAKLSYAEMAKRTYPTSLTVASVNTMAKVSKPVVKAVENDGLKDRTTRDRPKSDFVPSLGSIVVADTDSSQRNSLSTRKKSTKVPKNDLTPLAKTQEPHLLIVTSGDVSEASILSRQDKVMSCLGTIGIKHKILQAANPEHHHECQGLYALSGVRTLFPLFFHVDASGIPAFCGTMDAMEHSIEDGTFLERYGSMMQRHANLSVPSLVVLISQQSLDRNVKSNQERALLILDSKQLPYTTIDGADPQHQALRNKFFQISGLRGKYPQFFFVNDGEEMQYVGDWDHFQSLHEMGDLSQLFKATDRPATHVTPAIAAPEMTVLGNVGNNIASVKGLASSTAAALPSTPGPSDTQKSARSSASAGKRNGKVIPSPPSVSATATSTKNFTKTEITIYGATSFVAQHALDYFMQVSLTLKGKRTITLAGRNESKLAALQKTLNEKMSNLVLLNRKSIGQCVFDVFVADSADIIALKSMVERTDLIANFAGPYTQYGEHVVAACAQCGTNYIDITGEISWAGQMRQKYSSAAERSGARIISLCGFDSIPSDISIFACVDALRKAKKSDVPVGLATTWHSGAGMANGGTIHSALGMQLNFNHCFSQKVPFLLDDPLVLTHPRARFDPENQALKNRMAMHEWLNQLPSFDSILVLGASAPFFMSAVNAKVVQASAVAMKYGPNFKYRERFLPVGLEHTRKLGILSIVPALLVQFGIMIGFAVLRTPFIGKILADWLAPPGTGAPDYLCKSGFAKVYAEVSTAPINTSGNVDKATCFMEFEGDPGNWVTAQCLCESALALTLDKTKLPARSLDGFGTPAELLGSMLLRRLRATKVRPVKVAIHVRKNVPLRETVVFCGSSLDDL